MVLAQNTVLLVLLLLQPLLFVVFAQSAKFSSITSRWARSLSLSLSHWGQIERVFMGHTPAPSANHQHQNTERNSNHLHT